jgi:adenosine deaminase
LLDQYVTARDQGFSDAELAGLAADSIRISRADAATKRRLLADVAAWLTAPPADASS